MKLRQCVLSACVLLAPAMANASDWGILRTAIPIEKNVWRLQGGGVASLEENGREAVLVAGGEGLAKDFDFEAKLAIAGDDTALGGGVNYLLMRAPDKPVDLSVGGGFHYVFHDLADVKAVDVNFIASKQVHPRVAMYGALALSFTSQDVPPGADGSLTQAHLVPGLEYKINDTLNFVGELGLAVSDSAGHYIAGTFHYYLRLP